MGTRADHKKKADHNQSFLTSIDSKRYSDWVVTVGFYKAVHVVEALFATIGKHSDNHRDRHDKLKRDYPEIWLHYLPLYTLSRRARYKVNGIVEQTMQYALARLEKVEQSVNDVLPKNL